MTASELTDRQAEILAFIGAAIETDATPPTRLEIARHFGFKSANAAEAHLRALARKGFIALTPARSRGIRLLRPARGLPLVGRVAAGSPILAAEQIENDYQIDPALFSTRPDYLLRVRGMSMRDAGILEDDLLAVRRSIDVRNGDIVVARLDDEVTVKRYERRGDRVSLLPDNPDFEPIRVDGRRQSLVIEGRVVGVIRNAFPKR